MGIAKEFREFAAQGNMLDLAVGVIIGAAFGKVVASLVEDLLMPPIGRVVGNTDFKELFISLDGKSYESLAAAKQQGAATLNYGMFLTNVVQFLIVAFVVFLIIKAINRMRRPAEAPAAGPSDEVRLLTDIRDSLRTGTPPAVP